MRSSHRSYEIRPRKDKRGVDLISDALTFSGLSYGAAIRKSSHRSRRKTRSNDVRAFDRQEQPPTGGKLSFIAIGCGSRHDQGLSARENL
jgi:hypothetical protein